uniref:Uncharacterized protein n=1 Tax=Eutreptiella gymnastica TaxID=73025 RepID=A0A7S1HZL6_9EUGL|mmetsp:Transcript_117258/g.204165  ORF Transcript_117258/g.204165 Transcript_117258/m.204165 type:complete len:100 (+) Transcript_117258:203-502(+)
MYATTPPCHVIHAMHVICPFQHLDTFHMHPQAQNIKRPNAQDRDMWDALVLPTFQPHIRTYTQYKNSNCVGLHGAKIKAKCRKLYEGGWGPSMKTMRCC